MNDGGTWHTARVSGTFGALGAPADSITTFLSSTHVFVSAHARGTVHVLLVADGGDALGGLRCSDTVPSISISPWRLADGGVTRALAMADFCSINSVPGRLTTAGSGACGRGVTHMSIPVDPNAGALVLLVRTNGKAPSRSFSLSVCAEVDFDLRVATPGGGVGEPVAKVSDVLPGPITPLPPVPTLAS